MPKRLGTRCFKGSAKKKSRDESTSEPNVSENEEAALEVAAADEVAAGSQGTESITEPQGSQVKKKARQCFSLSDEQEELVVLELRENPYLWCKRLKDYKNVIKKNEKWATLGESLGVTGDYLKGWWRNVHTHYVKLCKTKSGQANKVYTDRERWILDSINFYKDQVKHRFPDPIKGITLTPAVTPTITPAGSDDEIIDVVDQDADEVSSQSQQHVDSNLEQVEKQVASSYRGQPITAKRRVVSKEAEHQKNMEDILMRSTDVLTQFMTSNKQPELPQDQKARSDYCRYMSTELMGVSADQFRAFRRMFTEWFETISNPAPSTPTPTASTWLTHTPGVAPTPNPWLPQTSGLPQYQFGHSQNVPSYSNYRSSYTNLTPPTPSFSPIEAGITAPANRGISPIPTIIPDIRVPVSEAPRIPVAAAQSISTIPAPTNQSPEIDNPSLVLGLGFSSDSCDTSYQSDPSRTLHTPQPPSPKGH